MEKIDARVIKTRKRLYLSFLALLSEKNYDDITINEICERAGIRRATFYKHFRDKFEFSTAMTAHLISLFDVKMQLAKLHQTYPIEYHLEYLNHLVKYLVANIDTIRLLGKSNMYPTLVTLVISENYKVLLERLKLSEINGLKLIAQPETVATVLAGGIGAGLAQWLMSDMTKSPEVLISEYTKIVRAMFIN